METPGQKQLDTRALEIASQANARVDGLEKLMTASIDGLRVQLAENRAARDNQHESAERHFEKFDKKFDQIGKWQMSLAVGVILMLCSIVGFLVAPHFH